MLHLWPGIYRIVNKTGSKIIPVIYYIYDPTKPITSIENPIHTVIADPIDLTTFSENAGLSYIRDVISSWYYLMLEKYGKITREELIGSKNFIVAFEEYLETLLNHPKYYDSIIETNAHYKPKNIVTMKEVWKDLSQASLTQNNNAAKTAAKQMIKIYKQNDFQSRF